MVSRHSPKTAASKSITATSRSFLFQFLNVIQSLTVNACAKLTEGVHGHLRVELNPRRFSEFMLLVLVQTAGAFRNVCSLHFIFQ